MAVDIKQQIEDSLDSIDDFSRQRQPVRTIQGPATNVGVRGFARATLGSKTIGGRSRVIKPEPGSVDGGRTF